jgi:hypothetical protein
MTYSAPFRVIDPLIEITKNLDGIPGHYHHDGDQNVLLSIADPATNDGHLFVPVQAPPGRFATMPGA